MNIFYQLTIYNHEDAFIRQVVNLREAHYVKKALEKQGFIVVIEKFKVEDEK